MTAPRAGLVLVGATILLIGAIGWLVSEDAKQAEQLGGISRVAPCRADGINSKECRRQARLIVKACITHPNCQAILARILPEPTKGGGTSNSAPPPHSQPPPPPSGGGGNSLCCSS